MVALVGTLASYYDTRQRMRQRDRWVEEMEQWRSTVDHCLQEHTDRYLSKEEIEALLNRQPQLKDLK